MQVVIDIDEGIFQGIVDGKGDEPRNIVRSFQATIADAIKNGTPLDEIKAEIDDATEIHSDGEFYIKNIDVKRIIDKYKAESEK